MQLRSSEHLDRLRSEVRAFIADHSPGLKYHAGIRAPEPVQVPAIRAFTKALFEAGYLGGSWPEEYGGRADYEPAEAFVVAEELARSRTWTPIGAESLAASALIDFGTQEQKDTFLPRIRS